MYGLGGEQTKPGTTLRTILEAIFFVGRGPSVTQKYIDRRIEDVSRGQPHSAVNELQDGRGISVTTPADRRRREDGSASTRTSPTGGAMRRRSPTWRTMIF